MDQFSAAAPPCPDETDFGDAAPGFDSAPPALALLHAGFGTCMEPRDLLLPERRAIPMLGRTDEMAALEAWLAGSAPIAVQRITGHAGVGKTRLAIELCARAAAQGWECGFAEAGSVGRLVAQRRSAPLLIVLDEAGLSGHAGIAETCASVTWTDGQPRRIVLIGRDAEGVCGWAELIGAVPAHESEPLHLGGLRSIEVRRALLGHAMSVAARAAGAPPCRPPGGVALDTGEPLHLIMAGLLAPHVGVAAALAEPPAALALRLAFHERRRLERLSWTLELDPRLLLHIAACVTLQAGCPLEAAGGLVNEEASAMELHLPMPCHEVADAVADALGSIECDALAPIGPDLVGAAFLIDEFGRHPAETQAAIIDRALRRAPEAVGRTLRRAAQDHSAGNAAHPALLWSRQAGG